MYVLLHTFYFLILLHDLMEKNYFKCYELFHKIGKELPSELQAKYYVALMEYWLYGIEPSDPVIKSLLQWPMYSIQRSNEGLVKKSNGWKKHTWNQYTQWDAKWKAQKTPVEDNGTYMEDNGTQWNKEDIEDKEEYRSNNKKENLIKEKTPSVSELLKAYEQNELLVWRIQNSQAVREWLEYKQKKKDRAYKSEKAFIQRLAIIVKTLDNWLPRPDIWERLSYAVNIATEKEWKDIYRTEQTELDYQSFKKFNSMQWTNKQQHE